MNLGFLVLPRWELWELISLQCEVPKWEIVAGLGALSAFFPFYSCLSNVAEMQSN